MSLTHQEVREKVLATRPVREGDFFYLSQVAECISTRTYSVPVGQVLDVIRELQSEGIIAKTPDTGGKGNKSYYRRSPASLLLKQPWDRRLDLGAIA